MPWWAEPGWSRILPAARRSLERNGGSLEATLSLAKPTEAERLLVIGITGVHRSTGVARIAIRLRDVDAYLRQALGKNLPDAIVEVDGRPLRDLPAQRREKEQAVAAALAIASASVHSEEPWFQHWLDDVRSDGLLTRFARSGADFGRVVRVLDALPTTEEPMPVFTERVLGDTKALLDSAIRGLVLRALARRAGVDPPAGAEDERTLWESVGVVPDDLASQALVLNLPASGGLVGGWLTSAASAGVPLRLTLHQLRQGPLSFSVPDIFVTENPAVLRAAVALGAAAPPVVCTEGIPSAALHRLLSYADRSRLWWRNDFDWPGVRMTAAGLARYPNARPWRMSAADYLSAVGPAPALRGAPAPTLWDPELAMEMARIGRAVMEERLIGVLLGDFRDHQR